MMINEAVASRYRGKMVRLYTRDGHVIQGFVAGGDHRKIQMFAPREGQGLALQQIPIESVRMVMSSELMDEKGRVCRYLYGGIN